MNKNSRTILALSGLFDFVTGMVALLIWSGLLPVDLGKYGIENSVLGMIGGIMLLTGFGMMLFILLQNQGPPDE